MSDLPKIVNSVSSKSLIPIPYGIKTSSLRNRDPMTSQIEFLAYGSETENSEITNILKDRSIWTRHNQIAVLFGRNKSAVSHLKMFAEGKPVSDHVVADNATTTSDGRYGGRCCGIDAVILPYIASTLKETWNSEDNSTAYRIVEQKLDKQIFGMMPHERQDNS